MEEIHSRMPVILNKEARFKWLDPDLKDTSELKEMLIPYPSEEMEAYENNSPMCIHPDD